MNDMMLRQTASRVALVAGLLVPCVACETPTSIGGALEETTEPRRWSGGWSPPIGLNNEHHLAYFAALDGGSLGAPGLAAVELMIHGEPHEVDVVWVEQGHLHGISMGVEYSGTDFLGSVWEVALYRSDQFEPVFERLVITAVDPSPAGIPGRYAFSIEMGVPDGLVPLCGPVDPGALVLEDLYVDRDGQVSAQADTLLIGCELGGVAKAVSWGYGPEAPGGLGGFEAAIRMVIADYCGDGTSYTTLGTPIWMKDTWGIHDEVGGDTVEAGWSIDGAACLSEPRTGALEDVACVSSLPACPADPVAQGDVLATWLDRPSYP
ncbi:MAG: ADYC domain-containing protein [Myxococcota bacterium]